MNKLNFILSTLALSGLLLGGCGDDSAPTDSGTTSDTGVTGDTGTTPDSSPGDAATDAPPTPTDCTRYCDALEVNCSANSPYNDRAECESYCAGADWPVGTPGDMSGNTIECRIYHSGDPASMDPTTHCEHAGPSGASVCGSVDYRTEAAAMYTRVDRLGMPAVSTALISSDQKNAYNDADPPADDTFTADIVTNLTAIHTALRDDLVTATLVPCSTAAFDPTMCVTQEVAAGVSVASLIVPDTISINPAAAAGFPNGRGLSNQVMDVTLGIILLDINATGQSAATLAEIPLNPAANDVAFGTAFPYLAAPHTP
ncbi:MAG: DUF4331 family protein [Deltaproteobacteria bacterium]|nr:DUF4331 family protein [Deltaproteobacteria bacterium]